MLDKEKKEWLVYCVWFLRDFSLERKPLFNVGNLMGEILP